MNGVDAQLLEQLLAEAAPDPCACPEFVPPDAPFDEAQRSFLNGLFAGLYVANRQVGSSATAQTPLNIYYASQTGTAEALSKALRKHAASRGFDAAIAALDAITPADLAAMEHVLIIAATYGEGEPPDNAARFYAALMGDGAPDLPETLKFSVCGLGDSSYPHFNRAAVELDARLAALGATRVAPLVTCDVDYDADFEGWRDDVFAAPAFAASAAIASPAAEEAELAQPVFDKNRPFLGALMRCKCLSGAGSGKAINHIEIDLTGGGEDLAYEVGDALGVWPLNDMEEVDAILALLGASGAETVELKSGATSLRQALFRSLDLLTVTSKAAEAWQVSIDSDSQLIDLLTEMDAPPAPQALVDGLRPLQPRLYSISSSPKKHPGEVHLTVGEVRYERNGRACKGVASTYLGRRLSVGSVVGVYLQRASHFGLPEDDDRALIMIGPGTGIAPFRAFLEEREMRKAAGRNWLFFGDQHEQTDYLYRDELRRWRDTGLLTRLSLAWSRDSERKVYVQHLIREAGAEFYRWLEEGAAVYVCGDAARMAPDVEAAIEAVVEEHGGCGPDGARAYLDSLKESHRYQRDVY